MAYKMGLRKDDLKEYYSILQGSHWMKIKIRVMDLDHNYLGDLSRTLLTGAVTIDTSSEITRSLQLQLKDLGRSINLAPDDPDDGAAYPTRMVRIVYCVARPTSKVWYECPIFTGPVTKAERDGGVLNIEAMGKEKLSMQGIWNAKTYGKSWNKGKLIKEILRSNAGETKFNFPAIKSVTAKQTVLKRGDRTAWQWAKSIARSMGMHIFYDGRGYLKLTRRQKKSVWTFTDSWITDDPQVTFDLTEFWNAVEVTGATPKGKNKKPYMGRAVATKKHPLSPWSLGRGGVPRYIPRIVTNTDLKSTAACKEYAKTILSQGLDQGIVAAFPAKVVPFLEEFDLVTVAPSEFTTRMPLRQATIPLVAGEQMSVGYSKPMKPSRLSKRLRRA